MIWWDFLWSWPREPGMADMQSSDAAMYNLLGSCLFLRGAAGPARSEDPTARREPSQMLPPRLAKPPGQFCAMPLAPPGCRTRGPCIDGSASGSSFFSCWRAVKARLQLRRHRRCASASRRASLQAGPPHQQGRRTTGLGTLDPHARGTRGRRPLQTAPTTCTQKHPLHVNRETRLDWGMMAVVVLASLVL